MAGINKSFVCGLLLLLVVAALATCGGSAQSQEERRDEFVKGGLQGLADMALDVVLAGVAAPARVIEKCTAPLEEIKQTINEEAVQFIKRIQQDSRVKAALAKIAEATPADEGLGAFKKLADGFGANLDKLGKDLNRQFVKPIADQARPLMESLEKKRLEIMEAHERRVAQHRAEEAINV